MAKKKAKKKTKKPLKKKAAPKKAKKAAPKKAAKRAPAKKKAAPKKAKKPAARPGPAPLPWRVPLEGEVKVGVVDDYFSHVSVIAFKLEKPLAVGERVHVRGHTTDLTQAVDSIQIEHQAVPQANAGDSVGIKVSDKCRKGDWIYKTP